MPRWTSSSMVEVKGKTGMLTAVRSPLELGQLSHRPPDLDPTPMYETLTRGIRVRVTPTYIEEESTPEENYFFWAYTVVIANEGRETVQLKSRIWCITDARGNTEEVRGPGVVGQTPVIPPGESFSYTSG